MEGKIQITPEELYTLKVMMTKMIEVETFTNEKLSTVYPDLGTIYHYTNLNTLISIIENQTLYFSNIYFLNDKKEFKYGVELILSRIDALKNQGLNSEILNMLTEHTDLLFKYERYVMCFSKNGDLLSQWRAYANNGKGVAIGFDSMCLDKSTDQIIYGEHINYNEKNQITTIDELIRIIINFFEGYKEIFEWQPYGYEWTVSNIIFEFLSQIIAGYKSPAFFEEQEYRFEYIIDGNAIKREDEKVFFRSVDTHITLYIKVINEYRKFLIDKQTGFYNECSEYPSFVLKSFPIKEIIIGPSLDFDMNKMAIEELLKSNGYDNVEIKKSNIPYRL